MTHKEIIAEFKNQFGHLEKYGLQIGGIANLIDDHFALSVSIPFIFDHRKLPEKFMGIEVRSGTPNNQLPIEFSNINNKTQYIWAYQGFELFVDNNLEVIPVKLENPNMNRDEMLDAICFGDFKRHKEACLKWGKEGKIPEYY